MDIQTMTLSDTIDCATCQALLPAFVDVQLANQDVARTYPAISLHIETCADCEAAYYAEFRRQGLQRSVGDLQRVGRPVAATAMDQIYASIAAPAAAATGWRERGLAYGRAWYDRTTDQLRRWEVQLAALLPPSGATPSLAYVGLQGGLDGSPELPLIQAVLDDAQTEVAVTWHPAAEPSAAPLLLVAVTEVDAFTAPSGVLVTVLWPDGEQSAVTDAEGKAYLAGVADVDLRQMQVILDLP